MYIYKLLTFYRVLHKKQPLRFFMIFLPNCGNFFYKNCPVCTLGNVLFSAVKTCTHTIYILECYYFLCLHHRQYGDKGIMLSGFPSVRTSVRARVFVNVIFHKPFSGISPKLQFWCILGKRVKSRVKKQGLESRVNNSGARNRRNVRTLQHIFDGALRRPINNKIRAYTMWLWTDLW